MLDSNDPNPLVCFCFNITQQEIIDAIVTHRVETVCDLSAVCKAGNGCSSCWGDIDQLIQQYKT